MHRNPGERPDREAARLTSGRRRFLRIAVALWIAALVSSSGACRSLPGMTGRAPVRIGELVEQGDPARRASLRLLVEGLEADVAGDPARAKGRYERAIQVDATNPYAYLTFARFEIDRRRPAQARAFLDQAWALFDATGGIPPRAEAHFVGLEAAVLAIEGRRAEAARGFEQARQLAPGIWADAYLGAGELL